MITNVVSEYNELGYSGTNSSGDLFIVNSVWTKNRSGIVPNTLDSEELPPQGQATIAGNDVSRNGDPGAARIATTPEFDAVLGGGVALIGSVGDIVTKNRVVDNTKVGIVLAPNPGLQTNVYPSTHNQVTNNVVQRSGMADLATVLATADDNNCFSGNTFSTTAPANLEQVKPCGGAAGTGDLATGALDIGKFLDTSQNPKGVPYGKTPVPRQQRNLPRAARARARPAGAPISIDLANIQVPSAS